MLEKVKGKRRMIISKLVRFHYNNNGYTIGRPERKRLGIDHPGKDQSLLRFSTSLILKSQELIFKFDIYLGQGNLQTTVKSDYIDSCKSFKSLFNY